MAQPSQPSQPAQSSQPSSESDIVKFNVGGETFEVLEQTIRAKPDTLLCTLLDEPAQVEARKNQQGDKAVFVEANAKLFPFILDWYRYGSILIPESIGIEQMKRECAFFQLPDEIRIKRDREPSTAHAVSYACAKIRKIQAEVDKKKAEFRRAKLDLEGLMVYQELMDQRLRTGPCSEGCWKMDVLELDRMREFINGAGATSNQLSMAEDLCEKVAECALADGWTLQLGPPHRPLVKGWQYGTPGVGGPQWRHKDGQPMDVPAHLRCIQLQHRSERSSRK